MEVTLEVVITMNGSKLLATNVGKDSGFSQELIDSHLIHLASIDILFEN
jgi:hypothetical protein